MKNRFKLDKRASNSAMLSKTGATLFGIILGSQYLASAQSCAPGYYSPDGSAPCIPAPPGYYVPSGGATSATPAAPGYYVPNFAAISQTPAAVGSYCPVAGMSA